jgi:hypothetical protein
MSSDTGRERGDVTEDAYFKKIVELHIAGTALRFRVAQDLFSSHEVDEGTRLLLRSLTGSDAPAFRRVLDLGCGYGPVGLTLKKLDERRTVHLVDRDALAVGDELEIPGLPGALGPGRPLVIRNLTQGAQLGQVKVHLEDGVQPLHYVVKSPVVPCYTHRLVIGCSKGV